MEELSNKMKLGISLILLIVSMDSFAQLSDDVNYLKADSIAIQCNKKTRLTSELALELTRGLTKDEEKFRSIFRWVTHNIEYSYSARKVDTYNVLRKKKAICSGYANLIKELCDYAMVKCEVVVGYAKSVEHSVGKIKETNHAWNAVMLDDKWYLVDATWAAGYVKRRKFQRNFDEYYYLADPDKFKFDHYPLDEKWMLTNQPLSKKEFDKMPLRREGFFLFGLSADPAQKGEFKRKLDYSFRSEETIYQAHIQFENQNESIEINPILENGEYRISLDLKDAPSGWCYIFLNGKHVLTFLKSKN